jgi:hypothetical protein
MSFYDRYFSRQDNIHSWSETGQLDDRRVYGLFVGLLDICDEIVLMYNLDGFLRCTLPTRQVKHFWLMETMAHHIIDSVKSEMFSWSHEFLASVSISTRNISGSVKWDHFMEWSRAYILGTKGRKDREGHKRKGCWLVSDIAMLEKSVHVYILQ